VLPESGSGLAPRPRGLAAWSDVRVPPAGERLAVPDRLPHTVFRLDRLQPGAGLPVATGHQPLAAKEVAPRVIGRVSRGDAPEARFRHLVALLDEGTDDPSQLFALLSRDRIAIAVQLIGRHLVRADGEVEAVVGDLQVETAGSGGGKVGAQMLLVGALVGGGAMI